METFFGLAAGAGLGLAISGVAPVLATIMFGLACYMLTRSPSSP